MAKRRNIKLGLGIQVQKNDLEKQIVSFLTTEGKATGFDYLHGRLASYCPRMNYFRKYADKDIRSKFGFENHIYMASGNGIESRLIEGFEKNKVLIDSDHRLQNRDLHGISGKIDAIILDSDEQIRGLEIKSCGTIPASPKYDHLQQALTYMLCSGIMRFSLVYVSRTKPDIKTFELDDVKPEVLLDTAYRIAMSNYAINNEYYPKYVPSDVSCYYCAFKNICNQSSNSDGKSIVKSCMADATEFCKDENIKDRYLETLRFLYKQSNIEIHKVKIKEEGLRLKM